MLELKDICREYRTGNTVQKALDCVNLTFADTEFVAILGPSGSGKTTLLNIIGGLDQYDSGDLIIDGISTKDYTARDWDAYRNRAVGFVFQNYNLITHLSILANVELALTLSGVSREERKKKAEDALRRVGLGDHLHKKPNQLSGGQMQRVAIARALVNDPRIILADEPTGALDSTTSVQVMDMLKEVSRDHLVIMVTHNPDLAEQYATRIVTIRDGRFMGSRSLPQNYLPPVHHLQKAQASNGHFRKTSMSFFTALSLSFQNLRTKMARTLMVSFAGSIGIIGIALILAIETGLQQYIRSTETATLSQYPIEIYATGIDWSSILTQGYDTLFASDTGEASDDAQQKNAAGSGSIEVNPLAKNIFTGMNSNDLASFKKYLETPSSRISGYASDIEYSYGVEPQIYTTEADGSVEQLNPNRMLSDMLTSVIDVSSLMNGFVGESLFHAMPSDPSLYEKSYEVKAGRWPENNHELVLVLTNDGHISDFMLYELGIRDPDELRQMIQAFSSDSDTSILNLAQNAAAALGTEEDAAENGDTAGDTASDASDGANTNATGTEDASAASSSTDEENDTCSYQDFLGRKFKLILSSDSYVCDNQIWTSKADDTEYMKNVVKNGEDLTIVGIVQAKSGASNRMLSSGIGYPRDLIDEIISRESQSAPVKAQLAAPDTDIFTGKKFSDPSGSEFDFKNIVSLDHDDVAKAFHVNTDAASSDTFQEYLSDEIGKITDQIVQFASETADSEMKKVTLSDFVDLNDLEKQMPQLTEKDLREILAEASSHLSENALKNTIRDLGSGYVSFLQEQLQDPDVRNAYKSSLTDLFRPVTEYIAEYLQSETAQTIVEEQVRKMIRENMDSIAKESIQDILQEEIQAYLEWVEKNNEERGEEEQLDPKNPVVIQLYFSSGEARQRVSELVSTIAGKAEAFRADQYQQLADALLQSFDSYAAENALPDLSALGSALAEQLAASLTSYLETENAQSVITGALTDTITKSGLQEAVTDAVREKLSGIVQKEGPEIVEKITQAAGEKLVEFADQTAAGAKRIVLSAISADYPQIASYINQNMGDFFTVNEDLFRNAIRVNAGTAELQSILTSFLNSGKATYAGNLSALGYADLDNPTEIMIYPIDFEAKNKIADLITEYNDRMKEEGNDDKVISYSDVVAGLMQSIIDIINTISRILMSFVSISLVVSSIMIGVITYISVLERKREIGILRAIGASRRNVREVFNAETVITGFLSGGMGVGFAYALMPLANSIIRRKTGQPIRASLPPMMTAALILLSVALTLLAGLLPAGQAARSDPVKSLRAE